jgi:hypothetical protein
VGARTDNTTSRPEWLDRLRWAAAVAAGTALPFAVIFATGRTVVWRDTAKLFEPVRVLVVDAIRGGRLPLWNPHEALGVPLFAQQIHAVLHPVSVLAALVAPGAGIEALAVAYVLLAALGAGALARVLGASLPAAAVAAFGFGLSGYVLGMTSVIQYLGAAATAPWAVAAIRAAGAGNRFGMAAAAAAVACLAFSGEPQWAIVAVLLGAALAADAGGSRGLARAVAAIAVGALVGGVQLLPAWRYFGESTRAAGVVESERVLWAFAPWRTLELVAPGFFGGRPGGPVAPVYYALAGGGPYGIPFVPSAFVGVVVLALAIPGAHASRAGRVLAAAALVALWTAFGHWLGAEQLLHGVPIWGAFRYAEKLLGPFTLCVAVLAGLGADRLAASPRAGAGRLAAAAAGVGLLAALLLASPATEDVFRRAGAIEAAALARDRLGVGLLHAAVALAAFSAVRFASRHARVRAVFGPAIAALVLAQSLAATPFALHAGPRNARDPRELEALRAREPVARVAVPVASLDSRRPTDEEEFERLSAVESRMGVPDYNVVSRVDEIDPYTGVFPRAFARVRASIEETFGPEQMWLAWRRFALTHVVLGPAGDDASRAIASVAAQGGVPVFGDPRFGIAAFEVPHRPWAFFASAVAPAGSEEEGVHKLIDLLASGGDAVILQGASPQGLAPGRVLGESRDDSGVRIEAEADGEALLVVNDAWWPGWEARIDNRPVPIARADALVRAIPWPAGRHVLEMRYAPRELTYGLGATVAGCIALVALVLADLRRARRREE